MSSAGSSAEVAEEDDGSSGHDTVDIEAMEEDDFERDLEMRNMEHIYRDTNLYEVSNYKVVSNYIINIDQFSQPEEDDGGAGPDDKDEKDSKVIHKQHSLNKQNTTSNNCNENCEEEDEDEDSGSLSVNS